LFSLFILFYFILHLAPSILAPRGTREGGRGWRLQFWHTEHLERGRGREERGTKLVWFVFFLLISFISFVLPNRCYFDTFGFWRLQIWRLGFGAHEFGALLSGRLGGPSKLTHCMRLKNIFWTLCIFCYNSWALFYYYYYYYYYYYLFLFFLFFFFFFLEPVYCIEPNIYK
jgi:hypothetical protein